MDLTIITILCSFIVTVRCLPAPFVLEELPHSRIVNGYEVDISEVPYQASLRRKGVAGWSHQCGATIISSKTLLTAAHCVTSYLTEPTLLKVVVGTSYRTSSGKSYDLKRIIVHEEYSPTTLENDIALLVVKTKMTESRSVKSINIAPKNYNLADGTEALVSGFGTITYNGSASPILLAAKVNIVNQTTCNRAYLGMAAVTNRMICASGTNPPRDACQGDSGGPLVANNVLIGIVSWGENCAHQKYPGVYTKVSEYEYWIVSRVEQYS